MVLSPFHMVLAGFSHMLLTLVVSSSSELADGDGLVHIFHGWGYQGRDLFFPVWLLQQISWLLLQGSGSIPRELASTCKCYKSLACIIFAVVPLSKRKQFGQVHSHCESEWSSGIASGRHDPLSGHEILNQTLCLMGSLICCCWCPDLVYVESKCLSCAGSPLLPGT